MPHPDQQPASRQSPELSPWWIRLIVFALLALIAYGAIVLIDQRAIERMIEFRQQHQQTNP